MSDTRRGKGVSVAGTGGGKKRRGGKTSKRRDESPARKRYREQKRGYRRALKNVERRGGDAEAYRRLRGI